MRRTPRRCVLAFAASCALLANAESSRGAPLSPALLGAARTGHPRVELDRLDFPDMPGSVGYERHFRRALGRAARGADWGVGRGHTIEYRIRVARLSLDEQNGVLHVRCTAVGRLPGGKTAASRLSFGGSPKQRSALVRQVLEIVARGVITRLAEMERTRRQVPASD